MKRLSVKIAFMLGLSCILMNSASAATLKLHYDFNDDHAATRGLNVAAPADAASRLALYFAAGFALGDSAGAGNSALALDGAAGNPHIRYYIESGTETALPAQFSASMWIKPEAKETSIQLFSNCYSSLLQNGFQLLLNLNAAGSIAFSTNNEHGVDHVVIAESAAGLLQVGQWQMITVVVDRTANTVKGYLNATEVFSGATSPGFNVDTAKVGNMNQVLFVGGNGDGQNFKGALDDFRLYYGLLSADGIAYLYATVPVELSSFDVE